MNHWLDEPDDFIIEGDEEIIEDDLIGELSDVLYEQNRDGDNE